MWKMVGALFVFSFVAAITVLITRDAMSAPQIGAQFGEIHNNGTGGGNLNNGTSSIPGAGYPNSYYSHYENDSAPTSPSASGGSLDMESSTFATSTCDCSQMSNVQETAPTNAPKNGPSDKDPAGAKTSASKKPSSSK